MNKLFVFLLVPLLGFSQVSLDKAEGLISEKKYSKAEKELVFIVSDNPNHFKGIELLGDAYGHQKKWDYAIAEYKKLVDFKPKTANYQYKYGGALAMKALSVSKISALLFIGDAKNAFLKAAELDRKHIDTRWALVELYMQLPGILGGSKTKSFKYANELEGLSKVDGYLSKGYIYEYDDEPELAERFYKKAILEGGSLTCFSKLTTLYENNNQPQKAIATIEQAQAKHKRNALHYQIGKVCAEYNMQLDKGERCLITYLENHSAKDGVPKAWANYRLAQIYKHQGKKENALKLINLAILEIPSIAVFKTEKDKILNL